MKNILLTGGAGYIGSHTATLLIEKGFNVILFDSLINSDKNIVSNIETITGILPLLIIGDIRDTQLLTQTISQFQIDSVIHFAGLKSVSESTSDPLSYFDVNVAGTISLLKAMEISGCDKLVFSSSATVYGHPQTLPIKENHPTSPVNPYGESKLLVENILESLAHMNVKNSLSNFVLNSIALRYFNPVGAHKSGLIGESPNGIPNNLMPYISMVASKSLPQLNIFGSDYDTLDGTGVRDYIHVMDLASGHLAALERLTNLEDGGSFEPFNLGTGFGTSVMEMLKTFEKVNNLVVPYEIHARRPGDIDCCFASVTKANSELKWKSIYTIDEMCASAWNFQSFSK
jgi:UDP-glucose 4-epimerase